MLKIYGDILLREKIGTIEYHIENSKFRRPIYWLKGYYEKLSDCIPSNNSCIHSNYCEYRHMCENDLLWFLEKLLLLDFFDVTGLFLCENLVNDLA